MNKNQFKYIYVFKTPGTEEQPSQEIELIGSFNIEKVIRTMFQPDGRLTVLLDDFNERVMKEPDIDLKTNRLKGYKSIRETVQSEIHLSKEEGLRFLELTCL